MKNNIVGWFEIPVTNMDRAIYFYETLLGIKLERNNLGNLEMAWFPWVDNGLGSAGSLVYNMDHYRPSADGVLIYLSSPSGDLANEIKRVDEAGGKLLIPKTKISDDIGFMAVFLDSEGNRIAIHSRQSTQ